MTRNVQFYILRHEETSCEVFIYTFDSVIQIVYLIIQCHVLDLGIEKPLLEEGNKRFNNNNILNRRRSIRSRQKTYWATLYNKIKCVLQFSRKPFYQVNKFSNKISHEYNEAAVPVLFVSFLFQCAFFISCIFIIHLERGKLASISRSPSSRLTRW